jgi:hypothetical protein
MIKYDMIPVQMDIRSEKSKLKKSFARENDWLVHHLQVETSEKFEGLRLNEIKIFAFDFLQVCG